MGCIALIQIMRGGQKVSVHISMELYVAHNNEYNQASKSPQNLCRIRYANLQQHRPRAVEFVLENRIEIGQTAAKCHRFSQQIYNKFKNCSWFAAVAQIQILLLLRIVEGVGLQVPPRLHPSMYSGQRVSHSDSQVYAWACGDFL